MTTPQEIEQQIKSLKPFLEKEFTVDKIGYFGSYAKGNQDETSDLDIIVNYTGQLGWKFFDLHEYLEDKLKLKVDLVTERSIKKRWREKVLSEVVYL